VRRPAITMADPSGYLGAIVLVTIVWMGLGAGGYFPPAWSWASLALGWVTVIALILRPQVTLSRTSLVFAGGLLAFTVWSLVSLLWTSDVTVGVQNVQRDLVYATAAALAAVCSGRQAPTRMYDGVCAGTTVVALYGLATWLAPDRLGLATDPHSPGRLYTPLGYWNAQGIETAIAILLAAGLFAATRGRWVRMAAAAAVPLLCASLYFTLSRGAILALVIGAIAWLVVEPARGRTVVLLAGLGPFAALAVFLAHQARALSGPRYSLHSASAGHVLAAELAVVALTAGAWAWYLAGIELRMPAVRLPGGRGGLAAVAAVIAGGLLALALAGVLASGGRAAYHAFAGPPPARTAGSGRVLSVSSNGRLELWESAWHDFTSHPLAGIGAGSFEESWLEHRGPGQSASRWAHSLYLESLAETGPVGMALLVAALLAPLVAGLRARRQTLAAPALAALVAFLVHAGSDWDWQVPAVTLAAVWCGSSLVATGGDAIVIRAGHRLVAALVVGVVVCAAAAYGLAGAIALSDAQAAARSDHPRAAIAHARHAASLEPWSYLPWMVVGQSRLALGDQAGAATAYATAARRGPRRWDAWLALAMSSVGSARASALHRAVALNPSAWQIRTFCKESPGPGCAGVVPADTG
jgi:O-Antigen ligase